MHFEFLQQNELEEGAKDGSVVDTAFQGNNFARCEE